MLNRRQLLALPPLTLAGCGITPIIKDGSELKANEGILALRVSANMNGWLGIQPYGASSFGDRFAENLVGAKRSLYFEEKESRLVVISLASGEYMWSKLETQHYFAWLLSSTRLRILAGHVTYIGNFHINFIERRFSIRIIDREQAMRDDLASLYPQYTEKMPFRKQLAELNARY